jgi:hypothetical protein
MLSSSSQSVLGKADARGCGRGRGKEEDGAAGKREVLDLIGICDGREHPLLDEARCEEEDRRDGEQQQ